MIKVRPKAERDLDDALALIETIAPDRRVTENKAKAKEALAMVKAVRAVQSFTKPLEKICADLKKLTRETAKHEGMQDAAMRIAGELETVIAEMQRRRKQRQANMRKAAWLLS